MRRDENLPPPQYIISSVCERWAVYLIDIFTTDLCLYDLWRCSDDSGENFPPPKYVINSVCGRWVIYLIHIFITALCLRDSWRCSENDSTVGNFQF
jgi:hypothetical protein